MVDQVVQALAALLVLAGFLAAQADLLDQRSWGYLLPNAVGSSVLAVTAGLHADWGFVFLEGSWALLSWASVGGRLAGREVSVGH
jgi:hypothetical protein